MYEWIVGGLAALDLGIKKEIERQEDGFFPRDLPLAKGRVRLHRSHNYGFPFGVMQEDPRVVKGLPALTASAVFGALGMLLLRKGSSGQKLGLSIVLAGAASNLYDRFKRGYVVDYFSIRVKGLEKVIFNLGDMFVFFGSLLFVICEAARSVREHRTQKKL